MNILPYQLKTTQDLLTSRAGLLCVAELMNSLGLSDCINQHFPGPKSNRSFQESTFVNAMMLMFHEGSRCLDDLRHIRDDHALRVLLGLSQVPESDTLGDWLLRLGQQGVVIGCIGITNVESVQKIALRNSKMICSRPYALS